jgi:hypothetical protein
MKVRAVFATVRIVRRGNFLGGLSQEWTCLAVGSTHLSLAKLALDPYRSQSNSTNLLSDFHSRKLLLQQGRPKLLVSH